MVDDLKVICRFRGRAFFRISEKRTESMPKLVLKRLDMTDGCLVLLSLLTASYNSYIKFHRLRINRFPMRKDYGFRKYA